MKKVFYSLMLGLAIVACEPAEYDDSALVGRMDELEGKVDKIAEDLATLQGNVDALKTLSQALKDGKYITSVVQDEATGNYTITFSNDETIFIEKGEQGIQGEQGVQGEQGNSVTVSEINGALYWILEGHNPIPVYKANPVFSSEDGKLYVQFEGEEKYEVGTLTGKSSFFENVKYDEAAGTVTFTLAEQFGGQSFTLAVTAFSLNISTTVGVTAGAVVDIPYTVLGANDKTVVDVFSSGAYVAEVVAKDAANGVVKVTVPSPLTAGNVLVWADNGEGKTSIRKISFAEEKYEVTPIAAAIPVAGGTIEVKGFSNVEFDVKSDKEWLTVVSVKSGDFTITLNAEENTGDSRSATVSLLRKGTETVLTSFEVSQEGKAAEAADPKLTRLFGFYSETEAWYTFGVGNEYGKNLERSAAMDDEYIYAAKSTKYPGNIVAWSIASNSVAADVTVTEKVDMTGIPTGDSKGNTFSAGNSINVIKNGEDYILLASNLSVANLEVWAWKDGIKSAPTQIINFAGGRYGDRFTVVGDWQKGELWFNSFDQNGTTLVYTISDGVVSSEPVYHNVANPNNWRINEINFIGDEILLTSLDYAQFYKKSSSTNAAGEIVWEAYDDFSATLGLTYDYNIFEVYGKKYITYVKVEKQNGAFARLIIREIGTGSVDDIKSALKEETPDFEAPIQHATDFTVAAGITTGNSLANCDVRVINGVVHIGAHAQGLGYSVFKFE